MRALSSILLSSVFVVTACSTPLQESKANKQPKQEVIEEIVEEPKELLFTGPGLSPNEQTALEFFQKQGIKDRLALATILGNIKQESRFHPNICEGGARVNYERCWTGGYGLIQWTTVGRYDGLGRHAKYTKCNPSEFECQLNYLVTEREWKEAVRYFKTEDQTIDYYMKGAYIWLGWGVYGARGHYSYQYYDFIIPPADTTIVDDI